MPELCRSPPEAWGGGERPSRRSSALGLSKYQTKKERKVVAAHRKKTPISDEGPGQLSHRISLLRGRKSRPYLPALQPQAALLPPSPGASAAGTARPGLLPTPGPAKEKEEVSVPNEKHPWQKAPGPRHKGLPICQIFKQSLNFAAGTYLGADLQDVLRDSA